MNSGSQSLFCLCWLSLCHVECCVWPGTQLLNSFRQAAILSVILYEAACCHWARKQLWIVSNRPPFCLSFCIRPRAAIDQEAALNSFRRAAILSVFLSGRVLPLARKRLWIPAVRLVYTGSPFLDCQLRLSRKRVWTTVATVPILWLHATRPPFWSSDHLRFCKCKEPM